MSAQIIDGITLSKNIVFELQKKLNQYLIKHPIEPKIAILQVGSLMSSNIYVKRKIHVAETLGIKVLLKLFPEDISNENIIRFIHQCNDDPSIFGILLQLPLPKHLDHLKLLNAINAQKDIDGLNPINIGLLFQGSQQCFIPPTAQACIEILKYHKIQIKSKHVAIVNRSNLVGKPLAELFLRENATVTICHSQTPNLARITSTADIVICAIGQAKFFSPDYFNPNAAVIDVGINQISADNKNITVGDVDFEKVRSYVKYITPVPKSIGPLTIAFLLVNVFIAIQLNNFP